MISPTYLFIWKQKNFYESLWALLEYFLKKKLPSDRHSHLGWDSFTELFLSNIMEYGKNDIEWQTSIKVWIWSDWLFGLFEGKRRKL